MNKRTAIHIVDPDSRVRAQVARAVFQAGHHAEVYAHFVEMWDRPPSCGLIIIRIDDDLGPIEGVSEILGRCGVWLPLVAMDEAPDVERVVATIKGGAMDFLELPITPQRLVRLLATSEDEQLAHADARRRVFEARGLIDKLSTRERQVLEGLAQGSTNKLIAKELEISPRTVEIHRANMMSKLGANHPADAVRLRLEAALDHKAA